MVRRLTADTTRCHATKRPAHDDSCSESELDMPVTKRRIRGRSMSEACDRRQTGIKRGSRSLSRSCPLNRRDCRKAVSMRRWRATRDECLPTVEEEDQPQEIDRRTTDQLSKRLDQIEQCLRFMFPDLLQYLDRDEVILTDSDDDSVTSYSENDSYSAASQTAIIEDSKLSQSLPEEISTPSAFALTEGHLAKLASTHNVDIIPPSFQASSPPEYPPSSPGGSDRSHGRHQDRSGTAEAPTWRLSRL
ncbi:hypothetical protein BDV26DRAFT_272150 [Aspergillus bertholletiae]|uniref:Uncharacterized protein n=1 Tax=Aspergillus bertholletiae TaxID=1226010 RepID=A0A5N7AU77_9EURO|nr:hypothetical protein BDV26DRAFT_272150 [Aspergillus bertholletiae]